MNLCWLNTSFYLFPRYCHQLLNCIPYYIFFTYLMKNKSTKKMSIPSSTRMTKNGLYVGGYLSIYQMTMFYYIYPIHVLPPSADLSLDAVATPSSIGDISESDVAKIEAIYQNIRGEFKNPPTKNLGPMTAVICPTCIS